MDDNNKVIHLANTGGENAAEDSLTPKERGELLQETSHSTDNMSLGRTLKATLKLLKPLFTVWPERHGATLLAVSVLAVMGLQVGAKLWQTQWMGQFVDSLSMTPAALFDCLKTGALMLGANAATSALRPYIAATFQLHARKALVKHGNEALLKSKAYHRIEQAEKKSNFEQRLTSDYNEFLTYGMNLATSLLDCSLRAITFAGVLYQISGPLYFSMMNHQYHLPGYMLILAGAYAAAGIALSNVVTKKLPGINNKRQIFENDLRNAYVRLKTNTAAVAQLSGEKAEQAILTEKANLVFKSVHEFNLVSLYLNLVAASHSLTGQVLPMIASSAQKYAGQITLGGVMQISGAFTELVNALTWPIHSKQDMDAYKPITLRLSDTMDLIAEACDNSDRPITVNTTYEQGNGPSVNVDDLTLSSVTGGADASIKPFDMTLQTGQRVLVVDPSGTRNASIIAALNDIWNNGKGSINIQAEKEPLSLTQNVYFPEDDLRGIICYPSSKEAFTDEEVIKALKDVGLSELIEHLDDPNKKGDDWLTLPEPQKRRINFARILLQKPQILFADNPALGLDAKAASELYKCVTEALPDTIMLTIAQDNSLGTFHNLLMEIKDGQMVPQQSAFSLARPNLSSKVGEYRASLAQPA